MTFPTRWQTHDERIFSIESHQTVKEILTSIKQTADYSSLGPIYVLNREDQLVGVFNVHELLMQNADTPAYKFMITEPIVVLLTTPIEVVIYKLLKYNILCSTIINRENTCSASSLLTTYQNYC